MKKMKFMKGAGLMRTLIVCTLVLFATSMFGESFSEIGNGIASMFDFGDSVANGIANTVHVGGAGLAITPVLFVLKGDVFEEFAVKSKEDLEAMKDDDREKYMQDLFDAQTHTILKMQDEMKKSGEDKIETKAKIEKLRDEAYKSMEKIMKAQGLEIEKLKVGNKELPVNAGQQVFKWLTDNQDELKKIVSKGAGMIELTIKAVAPISTGSATNPDGIPELVGTQMAPAGNINLMDTFVESLVTTIQTSLAAYPYTESLPKDGNFAFIGEADTKPQIDFKIETRYAEPVKVAAYEILSTESVQDIRGLESIANDLLRKKHALKKQNGILFGSGAGDNPKGATVYGRVFVPGAMANLVANPNIMDVINACITDVYTTHNYQDETPYLPTLAMMNPVDFFLNFVSAKDGDGKPLFPTASLFNRVNIGGVTIIPFRDIPTDKIFVADMSKYNITNYIDYTVKVGWINDQLITNQFTMVGESRFHAFVKKLDEQAFIYDDISVVLAAILKP